MCNFLAWRPYIVRLIYQPILQSTCPYNQLFITEKYIHQPTKKAMKIRSHFKNKKIYYSRTLTPEKVQVRAADEPREAWKDQQPNCEQLACCELIEESWRNGGDWAQGRQDLDAFLRVTSKIGKMDRMGNKNNFDHLSLSDIKVQSNKKANLSQTRKQIKTQQSFSTQPNPEFPLPEKLPLCLNSHLFIGKEVLNLTQYIITGPKWQLTSNSSIDCSRKMQRNRYIRVLKQMRSRNSKIVSEREQREEKVKENLSQIRTFLAGKDRDMEKLFVSSQRVDRERERERNKEREKEREKQKRARSLRNRQYHSLALESPSKNFKFYQ